MKGKGKGKEEVAQRQSSPDYFAQYPSSFERALLATIEHEGQQVIGTFIPMSSSPVRANPFFPVVSAGSQNAPRHAPATPPAPTRPPVRFTHTPPTQSPLRSVQRIVGQQGELAFQRVQNDQADDTTTPRCTNRGFKPSIPRPASSSSSSTQRVAPTAHTDVQVQANSRARSRPSTLIPKARSTNM